MKEGSILIVDDDPDVLHTARVILKTIFGKIRVESNPQQLRYILQNEHFDVVLLDMNYSTGETSGKEGMGWIKFVKKNYPSLSVVVMTAYSDLKLAVAAMKEGAVDFIVKPWENEKFQATLKAAYQISSSKRELSEIKHKHSNVKRLLNGDQELLIGESMAMQEVFFMIKKVANTDANVLLLGENGTGKEVVAQEIHRQSSRKEDIFVKVDLGTITESLFESELFGHKKGAFTDAKEDRTGRIVMANQGTLFLDEIGNLSLSMQAKLLSVLQSKTVIPVGDHKPVSIDCRIITATNAPLDQLVGKKEFREDLLYRLNTVEITIPPLRKRGPDIILLANYYLKKYSKKYGKELHLSEETILVLNNYPWPGNVRELSHCMERAVIMCEGEKIGPGDVQLKKEDSKKPDTFHLEELERFTILEAIRQYDGNMSQAAKALGLGRTTLYRKLEKYDINP